MLKGRKTKEILDALAEVCENLKNGSQKCSIPECMVNMACNEGIRQFSCINCALQYDYFGEQVIIPCAMADYSLKSIIICMNRSGACKKATDLEILTHEIVHLCMQDAIPACDEANAYEIEQCVNGGKENSRLIDRLKTECEKERKGLSKRLNQS